MVKRTTKITITPDEIIIETGEMRLAFKTREQAAGIIAVLQQELYLMEDSISERCPTCIHRDARSWLASDKLTN